MKKILISVLFGLAYRELHRDLTKRQAWWNRPTTHVIQLPLDPDELVVRLNAAIDDPDHPSWAAIRAADKARESMRKMREEGDT